MTRHDAKKLALSSLEKTIRGLVTWNETPDSDSLGRPVMMSVHRMTIIMAILEAQKFLYADLGFVPERCDQEILECSSDFWRHIAALPQFDYLNSRLMGVRVKPTTRQARGRAVLYGYGRRIALAIVGRTDE